MKQPFCVHNSIESHNQETLNFNLFFLFFVFDYWQNAICAISLMCLFEYINYASLIIHASSVTHLKFITVRTVD